MRDFTSLFDANVRKKAPQAQIYLQKRAQCPFGQDTYIAYIALAINSATKEINKMTTKRSNSVKMKTKSWGEGWEQRDLKKRGVLLLVSQGESAGKMQKLTQIN